MTLYLTDSTPPDEIRRAREAGVVALKLYPAGATTNSDAGVTDIRKTYATLEAMQREGLLLLVHGEVTDADIDLFDREAVFIERVLQPLRRDFPGLKIVFEHITTREAAQYVAAGDARLAATITAHHLLFNRNAIFLGGMRPHYYCLPVLKREEHRRALVDAATSRLVEVLPRHRQCAACRAAEGACGGLRRLLHRVVGTRDVCEAFDAAGALDKLEGFASFHGADFYGLPRNSGRITLRKQAWTLPEALPFGCAAAQAVVRRRNPVVAVRRRGIATGIDMIEKQPRIALLIDADNSPASKIDVILAELAKVGVTNIRRAYGNWKKDGLKGWEAVLHEYAIRPVQQFDYSKGKNATDMGMIIEAMDLLYTDQPEAYGIVTSDSDFTPLVMHLKAKGALVFGFGAKKTPMPFVNACSRFLYLENLGQSGVAPDDRSATSGTPKSARKRAAADKGSVDIPVDIPLDGRTHSLGCRRAEAGRATGVAAAQCGGIGGRRGRLVGARLGGPADRQPGLLRPAQLRLPQAHRPDRSDAVVRARPARHAVRAARQAAGQGRARLMAAAKTLDTLAVLMPGL